MIIDKEIIEVASEPSFWSQLTISLGVIGVIIKTVKYLITAEVKAAQEKGFEKITKIISENNAAVNEKIERLIAIMLKNNAKK